MLISSICTAFHSMNDYYPFMYSYDSECKTYNGNTLYPPNNHIYTKFNALNTMIDKQGLCLSLIMLLAIVN